MRDKVPSRFEVPKHFWYFLCFLDKEFFSVLQFLAWEEHLSCPYWPQAESSTLLLKFMFCTAFFLHYLFLFFLIPFCHFFFWPLSWEKLSQARALKAPKSKPYLCVRGKETLPFGLLFSLLRAFYLIIFCGFGVFLTNKCNVLGLPFPGFTVGASQYVKQDTWNVSWEKLQLHRPLSHPREPSLKYQYCWQCCCMLARPSTIISRHNNTGIFKCACTGNNDVLTIKKPVH